MHNKSDSHSFRITCNKSAVSLLGGGGGGGIGDPCRHTPVSFTSQTRGCRIVLCKSDPHCNTPVFFTSQARGCRIVLCKNDPHCHTPVSFVSQARGWSRIGRHP